MPPSSPPPPGESVHHIVWQAYSILSWMRWQIHTLAGVRDGDCCRCPVDAELCSSFLLSILISISSPRPSLLPLSLMARIILSLLFSASLSATIFNITSWQWQWRASAALSSRASLVLKNIRPRQSGRHGAILSWTATETSCFSEHVLLALLDRAFYSIWNIRIGAGNAG